MSTTTESLQQRLERLERERLEADRRYNEALTALDRSIGAPAELPHAPPAYDVARVADLNQSWDLLPSGPPVMDGSIKGRLRRFIWRLVGPSLEAQRQFNAAIVDHLNRNIAVHDERQQAAASTIALCGDQIAAQARFQSHLMQFLQTITLFVDTRSRSAIAGTHVLNRGLDAVSDDFQRRWESLSARDARQSGALEAMRASVEDLRATATLAQQTALSLKREVERLLAAPRPAAGAPGAPEAGEALPADLNSFKYLGFENEFRGPVEEIRRRLEAYVPLFDGQHDVLDVGCGRGEFLDLLRAKGIRARGIDLNDAMVEETRARGLDAEKADALAYLTSLPDGSLGGLFAAQVIEHLPADYLTTLVEVAGQKIRAGGVLVFETINPTCWVAFFESYIRDLTHVRPLHPETMQYLLRVSGFSHVRVAYSSPVSAAGKLAPLAVDPASIDDPLLRHLVETVDGNTSALNSRLFGYQDYAVIGRK
ncbi:MAG: class I SAM-dependent methyltransferase [Acidobacteria bacterium]|nr:class I SAM-dependent methyltransferase [Acidobacteriota bacterium]